MLQIGIIGGGIMGSQHMASVDQYHRSKIYGLSTIDHKSGRELANKYQVKYFEDYNELLKVNEIDAVNIATPDFTHGEIVIKALQANKHVLVEKPLTTDIDESRKILELAEKKNLKVMTLYNHRWIPSYFQTKQLLMEKRYNPILGYTRKNDRIHVPTEMIKWSDRTTSAHFLSSHDIDLLNWFFDSKVVEVNATKVEKVLKSKGINTPDAVIIQAKYKNGAIATFESCWIYPNTYPSMTDSLIEIVTEGEVFHLKRESEQLEYGNIEAYEHPRNLINMDIVGRNRGSLVSAIEHFIDVVIDDKTPYVSLESSHHITAILDAAFKSISSGLPQKVKE